MRAAAAEHCTPRATVRVRIETPTPGYAIGGCAKRRTGRRNDTRINDESAWPRVQGNRAILLVLLLGVPVMVPGAAAQDAPVVLLGVETQAETRVTEPTTLVWRVVSNDPILVYTVVAQIEAPDAADWEIIVEPQEAELHPAQTLRLEVRAQPGARADPRVVEFTLSVLAINATAALVRLESDGRVTALGSVLVLGQWSNPLPAPLDGSFGAFLLNLLAWLAIALTVMWFVIPLLRSLLRCTKTEVDYHVLDILSKPVFLVLFAFGMKQSLEVFRLPSWLFHTLDRLWQLAVVIAVVYVAYRLWHEIVMTLGKRLAERTESKLDDRLLPVFDKIGGIVVIIVGVFYTISTFGIDITLFAAGGVLVSMVIAFAAQDTLSNFFSGVHLMLDQPFQEGDWIVLDSGELTTVSKVGLRSTHLYHVVNHETIIVPNNLLATHRIINILKPDTRSKVRVDVGVAYGTDVQKVQNLLLDIARSHPLAMTDADHQPFVRFQNFGDSSIDFSIHFWVKEVLTRWAAASDVRGEIDRRFKAEGIEIPFPQRVIWHGDKDKGNGNGPGGKRILDHPKVKRDAAPTQTDLGEETGAEAGASGD